MILHAQRRHLEHKPITDEATISHDLKFASTNGTDGYGFIWDLETGRPIHTIKPEDGPGAQIFINPEGTLKLIRSQNKISIYPILDTVPMHTYSDEHVLKILGIAKGTGMIIYLDAKSGSGKHILMRMHTDGSDPQELLEFVGISNYVTYQRTDYYAPGSFYQLVDDNAHILYYNFAPRGKLYDFQNRKYASMDVSTGRSKSISYSDKEGYALTKPYFCNNDYIISENTDRSVRLCERTGAAFYEKGSPYFGRLLTGFSGNLHADFSADGSTLVITEYAEDLNNLTYSVDYNYYTTMQMDSKVTSFSKYFDNPDWKMAAAGSDGSKFAILFRDYFQQGAAIGFYDTKTGEEERVVYLQSGPARPYYPTKSQLAEDAKKKKEAEEAAEAAKYIYHCLGYTIVDDPSPDYEITIFYTGIVSFKSERKQTDLKSGVTMFCGDKALLNLEIQKLEETAKQKKGRLVLDTSLISNSEVFRNP